MSEPELKALPDFLRENAIYQIFLRAFTPEGTLSAAAEMLPHLADLGIGIVYLCPVVEADDDPRPEFWSERQKQSGFANPKNPYRMKSYFRIDPEYGTDADLRRFVEDAHALGLRVILDLVYLHCGPGAEFLEEHPEFAECDEAGKVKPGPWHFPLLNYRNPELREYLWKNMEYFIREFDIDGYRCDVSGGIPLDFWEAGRRRINALKPGLLMLAENEGNPEEQNLAFEIGYGFSFNHALVELIEGKKSAADLRKVLDEQRQQLRGARVIRCFDNHDIASDHYWKRPEEVCPPGATDAALGLCFLLEGIPFLYNGQEVADGRRHSLWANREFGPGLTVNWRNALTPRGRKRLKLVRKLLALRQQLPGLSDGPFSWIEHDNPENILAFRREVNGEELITLFNFSPAPATVRLQAVLEPACARTLHASGATLVPERAGLRGDLLPYGWVVLSRRKRDC